MKITHNSDYYNPQIKYNGVCPKYKRNATVTVGYTAKKGCKTDIQPTYDFLGIKCSLWDNKTIFPCVDCPLVPNEKDI